MGKDDREALRRRFNFRCGYCGVSERDAGAELTLDHFQPRSQGGLDEPENWVYCCHACNEFKRDIWQPDSPRRILHPLRDDLTSHVVEQEDGVLHGLSEAGTFHIDRLHLNRQPLIAFRCEKRLLEAARKNQARLLENLQRFEELAQSLIDQLNQFNHGDSNT